MSTLEILLSLRQDSKYNEHVSELIIACLEIDQLLAPARIRAVERKGSNVVLEQDEIQALTAKTNELKDAIDRLMQEGKDNEIITNLFKDITDFSDLVNFSVSLTTEVVIASMRKK